MDKYEPAPLYIGQPTTHTVEVVIQQWHYTRTFTVEVPTNMVGFHVLEQAIENIYEGLPPDPRDPSGRFAIVEIPDPNSPDGDKLTCEEADMTAHPEKENATIMSGLDWFKEMVVSATIKEVRVEPVPRPLLQRG